jgi:hypothetical protein
MDGKIGTIYLDSGDYVEINNDKKDWWFVVNFTSLFLFNYGPIDNIY